MLTALLKVRLLEAVNANLASILHKAEARSRWRGISCYWACVPKKYDATFWTQLTKAKAVSKADGCQNFPEADCDSGLLRSLNQLER